MPSEIKAAAASLRKLMGSALSLFLRGFNSSKCKTEAKLAVARIKLLRNRREVQVRQMRRDVAMLLDSHQESTARIRVEHVIREQNIMAANEIIELFCELIVVRLPIIAKQRDCPADLKEGISSLIFAAPRCSDVPELLRLRDIFEKKYGKDFVSAATDVRPESGVNRTLIQKLSVRTPSGEVKLKVMKDIAKEHQIQWDTTESELELLKPPEEQLQGSQSFLSASSMPVKPPLKTVQSGGEGTPMQSVHSSVPELRSSNDKDCVGYQFKDTFSAAQAAMELAEKATAAAQAAAHLAKQNSRKDDRNRFDNPVNVHESSQSTMNDGPRGSFMNSSQFSVSDEHLAKESKLPRGPHGTSYSRDDDEREGPAVGINNNKTQRRHSYNVRSVQHPEIRFDDSDGLDSECDEEVEMRRHSEGGHPPPNRPPPLPPSSHRQSSSKSTAVSRVHPKLPDYDELTARFEALRQSRS
uniref:IST1-like protein n=1 Tax=Anthurium amnicola TaxID=1678845 RepID=A0A1D1XXT6_9ARAE